MSSNSPEEVDHKEVPLFNHGGGYHLGEHEDFQRRLETFHDFCVLTAAASVYLKTGSLNEAASLMWWTHFSARPESSDDDEVYLDDEEGIRAWIDENRERIIAHAESEQAKAVAGTG